MHTKVIKQPTVEPITLEGAKIQAAVSHNFDNALIALFIKAAREEAEDRTSRSLANKTIELKTDGFSERLFLPYGPVTDVVSIIYLDAEGAEQTLPAEAYRLVEGLRNHIEPTGSWPSVKPNCFAVKITYKAGFDPNDDSMSAVKCWLLIRVASLYAQRESIVVDGKTLHQMPRSFHDGLLDGVTIWGGP